MGKSTREVSGLVKIEMEYLIKSGLYNGKGEAKKEIKVLQELFSESNYK